MTPFGIRKKLKSLLNPDGGRSEIVRHTITLLLPDGVERVLTTEEHYSILMAADASGITISTGRRAGGTCPDGHCGLCRLEVLDQRVRGQCHVSPLGQLRSRLCLGRAGAHAVPCHQKESRQGNGQEQ